MTELIKKLQAKCEARDLNFDDEVYQDEIETAISAVNERRGFTPTSDILYETKYSNLIVKMALYSLTKIGAEGETTHKENGIDRVYANSGDYGDLLNEVIPLVKS